jgi:sugar phosphate isomerase/epimerase
VSRAVHEGERGNKIQVRLFQNQPGFETSSRVSRFQNRSFESASFTGKNPETRSGFPLCVHGAWIFRRNEMKYGLCASLDNLALAERLGFDYIECAVSSIAAYSDEEFEKILGDLKAGSLAVERVNVLFPRNINLIGAGAEQKTVDEYLEKAFARVKALGGTLAVFGSGLSRAIPADYPFRKGYAELVGVTKRIGEIAAHYGITIAIEPLNREESNCINSLKEGAMLQADAASDNVGLLADLYHMLRENEPVENITAVKDLSHTHIALLEGRGYPLVRTKEVEGFFAALGNVGYTGTMSIEGKTADMEHDAAKALQVLRSIGG